MKDATDLIRRMRAEQPVHAADDPLRSYLSEVLLRDHARLLRLRLRKLHMGERVRRGDLAHDPATGALVKVRLPWWRWSRILAETSNDAYRIA